MVSIPLGGFKFDLAFNPPQIDQMSTRNSPGDLVIKSKLSPPSDFAALRLLNPIHKKGRLNFHVFFVNLLVCFFVRCFGVFFPERFVVFFL